MAIRARPKSDGSLPAGYDSANQPDVPGEYESSMTGGPEDPSQIVVDLGEQPLNMDDAVAAGPVTVDLQGGQINTAGAFDQPGQQQDGPYDHYENVALRLAPHELKDIGMKIHAAVQADLESREEWESVLAAGTRMLTSGEVEDPEKLAAPMQFVKNIKHPVFGIAVYQFQTRAYKQLLPPSGPAKCAIIGDRTEQLIQVSDRVETYMNYQLMKEDPAYAEQTDQLLLVESIDGSTFRKWYRDHLLNRNVGRWCRAVDVIVPYNAESMETALRITHRYKEGSADVHRKMLDPSKGYRQVALGTPPPAGEATEGRGEMGEVKKATDDLQGLRPSSSSLMDESDEYTFYEQQCYLDLSEHTDDNGNPTGIPLPYVVTIETETQEVVCIWRDWEEEDQNQRRLQHFAHYKFLPGPGFYGLGYSHLLVGIAAGTTAALRILLIGALFSSANGGFVTKDASGKIGSSISLSPGQFNAIDLTFDELKKAFYSPDFKQPAPALVQGIEMLLKAAERFSSTVEAMVGDAPTTGPVGTTLAMIEQSGEMYSGIHQRNHRAMADELRMQFRLNGIYVPKDGYPYVAGDQDATVYQQDFNEQVGKGLRPVSDPNIFSSTQRIALAQAQVQIATEHPDIVNKRVAIMRLLEAMRVPEPKELEVNPAQAVPSDPITENAMCYMGMPLAAEVQQDHDGHNLIHAQVVQDQNAPQMSKASMASHIAEHMALKVLAQAMAAGLPVQVPKQGQPGQPPVQKIDPRMERAITQRAVQMVQQQKNQTQAQQTPEQIAAQGDAQAKLVKVKGDLAREAGASRARVGIAAQESQARMRLKETEQLHSHRIATASANFKQRLDAHAALTKGGAQGPAVDASQAGVDEAQAALTRAVSDLTDSLAALAKQMNAGMDSIMAELETMEPDKGPAEEKKEGEPSAPNA